jgi:hypothetical protein
LPAIRARRPIASSDIYDDGTAIFIAPNPARRCTAYSIAAHSLYEESHPQLQFYPEGILVMEKTQFFSRDDRSAGIRNSRFVRSSKLWPWSIKLEGSRRLGVARVSLIHIDPADLALMIRHTLDPALARCLRSWETIARRRRVRKAFVRPRRLQKRRLRHY